MKIALIKVFMSSKLLQRHEHSNQRIYCHHNVEQGQDFVDSEQSPMAKSEARDWVMVAVEDLH